MTVHSPSAFLQELNASILSCLTSTLAACREKMDTRIKEKAYLSLQLRHKVTVCGTSYATLYKGSKQRHAWTVILTSYPHDFSLDEIRTTHRQQNCSNINNEAWARFPFSVRLERPEHMTCCPKSDLTVV